jgi:hypothetical protein
MYANASVRLEPNWLNVIKGEMEEAAGLINAFGATVR